MPIKTKDTKKKKQLGMPIGTASARLKKLIMFDMARRLKINFCFQCNKEILVSEDISIEHKIPYLDSINPVEMFFKLDNIAFSHLTCNIKSGRRYKGTPDHGSSGMYRKGCRCDKCREYRRSEYMKREKGIFRDRSSRYKRQIDMSKSE